MECAKLSLNFCRLCLKEEHLLNYFYIAPEEIEAVLNVGLLQSNGVPPFICLSCKDKFDISKEFLNTIKYAQDTLANLEQNGDLHESAPFDLILNEEIKTGEETAGATIIPTLFEDVAKTDYEISTVKLIRVPTNLVVTATSADYLNQGELNQKKKQYHPRGAKSKSRSQGEERDEWLKNNTRINDFYNFKCDYCEIFFATYVLFVDHMRYVHKTRKPLVNCCNRQLKSRCHLLDHMNYHIFPDKLTCEMCGKVAKDSNQLKNHVRNHSNDSTEKQYECEYCSRRFLFKSSLKYHLSKHMSAEEKEVSRVYGCKECNAVFTSPFTLKFHVNSKHLRTYAVTCELCGKVYPNKTRYKVHFMEHHTESGIPEIRCPECKMMFKQKSYMERHFARVHRGGPSKTCEVCGRECINAYALEDHVKNQHTQVKLNHSCEECGKKFRIPLQLREHKAMHHGSGPLYTCTFCDRMFNSNANMYSHRKKMHTKQLLQLKKSKTANNSDFPL